MRTPLVVGAVVVVMLGAALVPVPGVLVAAAAGVIPVIVALSHSVRDAAISTVLTSALAVIAIGASTNVVLSVVFMGAIAVGVAAARRVGRGLVASAVAALLAAQVLGPARIAPPESALTVGGMALAAGLVLCAVAIFVIPWRLEHAAPRPRDDVARFAAIVVPVTVVVSWACLVWLPGTSAWWALVAAFVALIPSRSGSWRRVALRAALAVGGAALGGVIVTLAGGTPVLALASAVILLSYTAVAGRSAAFRFALALSIVLLGSAGT